MSILDKIPLPEIDGVTLGKSFVLRRLKRGVDKFLEAIGPERLAWMIENDVDLSSVVSPEVDAHYRQEGSRYAYVTKIINDEDVLQQLPPWLITLVDNNGEKGIKWLARQMKWLKEFLLH